jgi:hypothetical protein
MGKEFDQSKINWSAQPVVKPKSKHKEKTKLPKYKMSSKV